MGRLWYIDSHGKRKRTPAGVRWEHEKFQSSRQAKDDNAARKRARYKLEKEGKVTKFDGKDVHHIHGIGGGNSSKNLRAVDRSSNRGYKEKSRLPGSKRKGRKK